MLYHHRDDEQRTELRLEDDGRLSLDRDGYAGISHRLSRDDALDLHDSLERFIKQADAQAAETQP